MFMMFSVILKYLSPVFVHIIVRRVVDGCSLQKTLIWSNVVHGSCPVDRV